MNFKIILALILISNPCFAMRRVKRKIPVDPAHKFTQSEFHALKRLNPRCVAPKFLEREVAHKGESDVFAYHGCSNHLHPIQDFYKAVHSVKKLKKPASFEHPHEESFIFLRDHTQFTPDIPHIDYPTNTYKAPRKHGKLLNDHDRELRKQLLACSYSLFDNEYGESALYFFEHNFSQLLKHNSKPIINENFEQLDKKHEISKTYDILSSTGGNLLQIIIPKHLVAACAYVCRPYGFPYHDNPNNNPDFFNNDELGMVQFIDQVRRGTFCVDRWQGPPQLKVVLTQRYFSNPESGIKIYRHTDANEETINKFMQERKKSYEKIIPDLERI